MKKTVLFGIFMAAVMLLSPLAMLTPAAQASTTASPAYGQQCVYHTVRYGENLSSIGDYYGVNMWVIAQRNGIYNPNYIWAGQTLLIYCYTPKPPAPPKPPKPPAPPKPVPTQPPYYAPPAQPGDGPAASCSIPPQNGFGTVWTRNASVRDQLGCPSAGEQGFSGAQQTFYSGFVIASDTTGTIFAMYKDGGWQQFRNTWVSGEPISNPTLTPPAGWYQPEYGIGKMWRNEAGVSQRLGWARWAAGATNGTVQLYQGGVMVWTPATGVWVLYNNGTYKRF